MGSGLPPPLRMMSGPVQHFHSAILDAWRFQVFARLSERQGFLGGEFCDFHCSLQLLTSSHLRERDEMLLRAILCGSVWNGFLLGKAKKEDVPCRFCGRGMVMVICSGVSFTPPSSSMFGNFLNLLFLYLWIVANGLVACFGMVGCLVFVALIRRTPGLPLLVIWLLFSS